MAMAMSMAAAVAAATVTVTVTVSIIILSGVLLSFEAGGFSRQSKWTPLYTLPGADTQDLASSKNPVLLILKCYILCSISSISFRTLQQAMIITA